MTTFSHADGFVTIGRHEEIVDRGQTVRVQLIGHQRECADLVMIGSHCVGADYLMGQLQRRGFRCKLLAVGSLGGLTAAGRGECDLAGVHLLDPQTGEYNRPFLEDGMTLVRGYARVQGIVYRIGDSRFCGRTANEGVRAALADPHCVMINRNRGSGTRALIDQLLGDKRPNGYAVQPKSHNAVAAAVSQGRADWGVAIEGVATSASLGFAPLAEEQYDFVAPSNRLNRPAVRELIALLAN